MPDFARAGARLHYEVEGEGPLVLLLHGFTGSAESFLELSRTLRRRFRVARLELLGHGRSDAPPDPARYGVWEEAKDALALVDSLAEERAHVLGYSLGGRVAMRMALLAPARIRSLVLESASPGIAGSERPARQASDLRLSCVLEEQGIEAFTEHWERLPLFASQARCPPGRLWRQRETRLRQRPYGLAQSLRGAGQGVTDDVLPRLREIRCPTLLVAGALDAKYRELLSRVAGEMPMSRLAVVMGAGHNAHLERPRIFARMVDEFLARAAR